MTIMGALFALGVIDAPLSVGHTIVPILTGRGSARHLKPCRFKKIPCNEDYARKKCNRRDNKDDGGAVSHVGPSLLLRRKHVRTLRDHQLTVPDRAGAPAELALNMVAL